MYVDCFIVYCLCKLTQLEKQDNRKCIFATDGILEQNSVRRTFKRVASVYMFDHGCASLVFLWSAMVVYPCDIHKVSTLLTGKKGELKKEVLFVAMMTNFGFGPQVKTTCTHPNHMKIQNRTVCLLHHFKQTNGRIFPYTS